ncbi:biogenesis of lysosome-related organelles complex 1 subunit 5 isoform X1 [Bemisia tabaci]|uniref:biogenesis of lysosome-related organelles complex 1 subunit 5 isoform X1 n=1 Tax=Bemisia tabaci TaxID=7038 RepID=UPI003B28A11C
MDEKKTSGIGEVYSRLFDHQPFLQSEIKSFVYEFEEKRGDQEVSDLFEILEKAAEIKDSQIDRVGKAKDNLIVLQAELDKVLVTCNNVLAIEDTLDRNSVIKAGRETRAAEFQHFFENLNEKYKSVDESFKEKEDHLKSYYKQLESKLNLTAKPQQLSA